MKRLLLGIAPLALVILASCGGKDGEVTILNVTPDAASPVWFPDSESESVVDPVVQPSATDSLQAPEQKPLATESVSD